MPHQLEPVRTQVRGRERREQHEVPVGWVEGEDPLDRVGEIDVLRRLQQEGEVVEEDRRVRVGGAPVVGPVRAPTGQGGDRGRAIGVGEDEFQVEHAGTFCDRWPGSRAWEPDEEAWSESIPLRK